MDHGKAQPQNTPRASGGVHNSPPLVDRHRRSHNHRRRCAHVPDHPGPGHHRNHHDRKSHQTPLANPTASTTTQTQERDPIRRPSFSCAPGSICLCPAVVDRHRRTNQHRAKRRTGLLDSSSPRDRCHTDNRPSSPPGKIHQPGKLATLHVRQSYAHSVSR